MNQLRRIGRRAYALVSSTLLTCTARQVLPIRTTLEWSTFCFFFGFLWCYILSSNWVLSIHWSPSKKQNWLKFSQIEASTLLVKHFKVCFINLRPIVSKTSWTILETAFQKHHSPNLWWNERMNWHQISVEPDKLKSISPSQSKQICGISPLITFYSGDFTFKHPSDYSVYFRFFNW